MLRIGLLFSIIFLVASVAVSVIAGPQISNDAQIPVHWGLSGQPDLFLSKSNTLLTFPALSFGLALAMSIGAMFLNKQEDENNKSVYLISWVGALSVFLAAQIAILHSAILQTPDLASGSPVLFSPIIVVAILTMTIGNYLPKTTPNKLVGVRLPWTLKSNDVWKATNRTAGWGLTLTGLFTIGAFFLTGGMIPVYVLMAGTLFVTLTSIWIAYSVDQATNTTV